MFWKKNLKTVSGLHLVWWKIVFHGNNENRIHAILKIYVFIFLHSNYQQSRLQISTKLKIVIQVFKIAICIQRYAKRIRICIS